MEDLGTKDEEINTIHGGEVDGDESSEEPCYVQQATGKGQQAVPNPSNGRCSRFQGCLSPFCNKETCGGK